VFLCSCSSARPASVLTTPAGEIFRIVKLRVSATNRLPEPSTVIPEGLKNRALGPLPSRPPAEPAEPPTVLIVPSEVIFRIV
jgi:hypothetical protein